MTTTSIVYKKKVEFNGLSTRKISGDKQQNGRSGFVKFSSNSVS